MSPEYIVEIIRKNVNFGSRTQAKKWDSLPMDVRWILKEAAEIIENQEEYIKSITENKEE